MARPSYPARIKRLVISTEAAHSIIVRCQAEKSALLFYKHL
jgi:hypothetical protein